MTFHDGMAFTTSSHDNDLYDNNCAQLFGCGWWYNICHRALLTGLYGEYPTVGASKGIRWAINWGTTRFARFATMAIQRN